MVKRLKSNKYQCSVEPGTVAHPVARRSGVVEVENIPEQRRADFFFKKEFALAKVDGRHRGICTQRFAEFAEPGTQ